MSLSPPGRGQGEGAGLSSYVEVCSQALPPDDPDALRRRGLHLRSDAHRARRYRRAALLRGELLRLQGESRGRAGALRTRQAALAAVRHVDVGTGQTGLRHLDVD